MLVSVDLDCCQEQDLLAVLRPHRVQQLSSSPHSGDTLNRDAWHARHDGTLSLDDLHYPSQAHAFLAATDSGASRQEEEHPWSKHRVLEGGRGQAR